VRYDGQTACISQKFSFVKGVIFKMIKAKVTKNIMAKSALNIAGIPVTIKQLIAGTASLALGVGEFFLLENFDTNAKMSIIFLSLTVCICFSIVQINGLPFHKFLLMGFKGVDKRPFSVRGLKNNEGQ
jgi:hypothetical protein